MAKRNPTTKPDKYARPSPAEIKKAAKVIRRAIRSQYLGAFQQMDSQHSGYALERMERLHDMVSWCIDHDASYR